MANPFTRWLTRRRLGEPVVIVSGLPRSGTSMMMRMLEAGGLEIMTDGARGADEDNPRGYWEYERVKDLEKDPDKSWVSGARGKVLKVISHLLLTLPEAQFLIECQLVIATQERRDNLNYSPSPVRLDGST